MYLSLVHPDVINHVRLLHHLLPIISGGPEFPPDEEYYLKNSSSPPLPLTPTLLNEY